VARALRELTLRDLGLHAVVGAVATWPVALTPLTRLAGHTDGDVWNHAWGAWWFWTRLSSGELPWRCDELFGPEGGTLWYIDPLGAGLTAVLVPVLGAAGAWNVLQWASAVLASWAAAQLAARVAGEGPHVYLASAALALGPYLNGELHNGISEACNVGPGLLALTLADAAFREGRARHWIGAGLALGVTTLGTPYYALAALLCVVTWSIPWLWRRPALPQLGGATLAALATASIAVPAGLAVQASVHASDALVHRSNPDAVSGLLLHNGVDPRTFVAPLGFTSVDYAALGEAFVHSGYLGLVALALAARGLRRTGRWGFAVGGVVTLAFALGPWLFWNEGWALFGGRRLALPYKALELLVPGAAITHPLRLAVPGLAVVGALAAAGVADLAVWKRRLAIVLVAADMLVFARPAWPLSRTEALDLEAAHHLAKQDAQVVLDLPGAVGSTMATSRYLVHQTAHGHPIPYRPDARASSASLLGTRAFTLFTMASETRETHREMLIHQARRVRTVRRGELRDAGVSHVVVHRELERGRQGVAATEDLLQLLYGPPEVFGPHAVYKVAGSGVVVLTPELHHSLLHAAETPSSTPDRADAVQGGP